jgi:hypothetical protein
VKPGVSVVIPWHAGREDYLELAVASAWGQLVRPAAVHVVEDTTHAGAAATRDRGLCMVETEWTAFLDSDDVLYAEHLRVLLAGARIHGADYVYSYFHVVDALGRRQPVDPLGLFGRPFDPARPTQTTVTILVKTELAQAVGFREPPPGALIDGERYGEDFDFCVRCVAAGAKVVHVPRRTWGWRHWGRGEPGMAGNTSGLGSRW